MLGVRFNGLSGIGKPQSNSETQCVLVRGELSGFTLTRPLPHCLARNKPLWHKAHLAGRRSSGVERALGKGEASGSIPLGGTSLFPKYQILRNKSNFKENRKNSYG